RAARSLPRLAAGAPRGEQAAFARAALRRARRATSKPPSRGRFGGPGEQRVKHRLEYAIVRVLIAAVRVMPDVFVRACGTALGIMFYTVDGAHRRIADRNLAAAFPLRTPAERKAIARAAFAHFGRLLFELLKFSTLSKE